MHHYSKTAKYHSKSSITEISILIVKLSDLLWNLYMNDKFSTQRGFVFTAIFGKRVFLLKCKDFWFIFTFINEWYCRSMHRCAENTVINEKKKNLIVITLLVFSVTAIGMHSLHCRISDIYGNTIILSSLHYPRFNNKM